MLDVMLDVNHVLMNGDALSALIGIIFLELGAHLALVDAQHVILYHGALVVFLAILSKMEDAQLYVLTTVLSVMLTLIVSDVKALTISVELLA